MPTSGGHDSDVHASLLALIGQDQRPDHVGADCLELVVFAPVDVRTTGLASTVDNVRWFDLVEDFTHLALVLHADGGGADIFTLRTQQSL